MPTLKPNADVMPLENFSHGFLLSLSPMAHVARLRLNEGETFGLVGRVRLDRRDELKASLESMGGSIDSQANDADLCLKAYIAWGDMALTRIHGDFAFAIWDGRQRKLMCARDRLGVRPLVYLKQGTAWWVSDSLADLISASSFAGRDLDRIWISGFLNDGFCEDPTRTVYAGVHRLPAAHTVEIGPSFKFVRRYWNLQLDEPLPLRSSSDYTDRFQQLLINSIRDRMPQGRVGIMMSGGLDSATLAAKTIAVAGRSDRVAARTWLAGGARDPEARMSRLVAEHLGIQHDLIDADRLQYDHEWRKRPSGTAEPDFTSTYPEARGREYRAMADEATVWFYGEGPDNALTFEWRDYLAWLARQGMFIPLAKAAAGYLGTKSRKEWDVTLRGWTGKQMGGPAAYEVPHWIRYFDQGADGPTQQAVSWRPRAFKSFRSAIWPSFFEKLDSEYHSVEIDWRHPFLDLRLLEFMLSTPPVPWGRRKLLIRRAMAGQLPNEILTRDKTPLHHDKLAELLRLHPPIMPTKGAMVEDFVDLEKLPHDRSNYINLYSLLRLSILDQWLKTRYG